eukprot:10557827-Alexandrium_andersonii.AAC.1
MSASLVGSEMCIRDRLMSRADYHGDMGWRNVVTTARGSAEEALEGYATVSYTHLTLPTICSV